MSFDRNDPVDLLALKTEVETDPAAIGYAAVVDNTAELLALLNDPANNTGVEVGADALTNEDLLEMLFVENISAGDQFRVQLLFEMSQTPQDDISRFKNQISALDTGLAAAIAAHVRPLSRADVLFGEVVNSVYETVSITRDDWIAARDS